MIFYYIFLLLLIITLSFVNFKIDYLGNKIGIFDKPDKKRKFHAHQTPILGWLYTLVALFYLFILNFFDFNNLIFNKEVFLINNTTYLRSYFSLFIGSLLFFIIGIYDDKHSVSPNKKIFYSFLILYLLIAFDKDLLIHSFSFKNLNLSILLENFSFSFTILCIFFLINSLNLYDGINLQSGIFFSFIYLIFIFKGFYSEIFIFFFISNLFFLAKNYSGKIFYGDSGIYLNSFIIAYFLIKRFNTAKDLWPELIIVIFFLPTIDLLRLFLTRIMNLKNPFYGDRFHIHHILLGIFKNKNFKVNFILFIMLVLPYFLYDLIKLDFFISLLPTFILYLSFIILFFNSKDKYEKN